MSGNKKYFSLKDMRGKGANKTTYLDVEAHDGVFKLGTISSLDILEWSEETDESTPEGKQRAKHAGIRFLVRCLVDGESLSRVPPEEREDYVKEFLAKDGRENRKLVLAAYALNGLGGGGKGAAEAKMAELKNGSSEAGTVASPTDSQPTSAE